MTRYLFIGILLIWGVSTLVAQDSGQVSPEQAVRTAFTAFNGAPLIGEPVELTLSVEVNTQLAALIALPEFPEEWGDFIVIDVADVVETELGNTHTYQQVLKVILWEPGEYTTPETYVSFRSQVTGQTFQSRVQDAFFTVTTVLDGTDLDLRPLKSPLWLDYVSPWIAIGGVLAFSSVTAGVIWFLRRRSRLGISFAGDTSPLVRALRQIDGLGREGLPALMLYPLVADCLREYIQSRYKVRAQDMTTAELLLVMQENDLMPERLQGDLQRMLESADLVKFASMRPGNLSAQQLLATAKAWLERAETFAPTLEVESAHD